MSTWTVNGFDLDSIDFVEGLSIVFQNQDDDYADFRLRRNYDQAIPDLLGHEKTIAIRNGSRVVFRGEVSANQLSAGPFSEYRSVTVRGPWGRFREMPFLYVYPYATGSELSTHGILGGDANALVASILATNAADVVQIGAIDLGTVTIPEQEVYDQTLAQVLQSILRFIPGAQVCFDYQTDPPTIYVLADNSAGLETVELDPDDGSMSSLRLAPLYDRLVDGVTLQYEANGQTANGQLILYQFGYGTGVNTISSPIQSSGFFIVGTDSAGDARSRRHFRRTVLLSGAYDVSTYVLGGQLWTYRSMRSGKIFSLNDLYQTGDSGSTLRNLKIMADWSMFARMVPGSASNFSINLAGRYNWPLAGLGTMQKALVTIPDMNLDGVAPATKFRPLIMRGAQYNSIPNPISFALDPWWPNLSLFPSLFYQHSAGDGGIRAHRFSFNWQGFSDGNGNTGYYDCYDPERGVIFIDTTSIGSVNASTGHFLFTRTVNNSSAEIPPQGIAAQILAANSRLLWDGDCSVRRENAAQMFLGLKRRVSIPKAGAETVVQRVSIDAATGQVDLVFGAPQHLGPQDLISLYRASRN